MPCRDRGHPDRPYNPVMQEATFTGHFGNEDLIARLHERAERIFKSWRSSTSTLQATALVNEAFVRLESVHQKPITEGHFLALVTRTMRRAAADQAKHKHGTNPEQRKQDMMDYLRTLDRLREDRPSDPAVKVEIADRAYVLWDVDVERLYEDDQKAAEIVDIHLGAAMPFRAIGELLGISESTAHDRYKRGAKTIRGYRPDHYEP